MSASKIQWTDRTWNPVRGCSRVSEGCRNCYAEREAGRFNGGPRFPWKDFVARTPAGPRWTGKVSLIEAKLREPLSWRKPCRVFVNSMSDLFHEALPDEAIDRVFATMVHAPRHTFQVLTKRPERMRAWINGARRGALAGTCPRNVWLGVSCENQETADERIPILLDTPAAVRFVSYEPALGPVDFDCWPESGCPRGWLDDSKASIDWLIVGGESGPGARPCDVAWIRSAVAQCRAAGTSCFVKQLGARPFGHGLSDIDIGRGRAPAISDRKGGDPSEWPSDLRVREFPGTRAAS